MSEPKLKRCSKGDYCVHGMGCWQPATTDHFHKSKRLKDGLQGVCKACRNEAHPPLTPRLIKRRRASELAKQGLKECSRLDKCVHPKGAIQPMTNEHFDKSKTRKDGFEYVCRACRKEDYAQKHPLTPYKNRLIEIAELADKGLKRCTKCEQIKPMTNEYFNKSSDRKDGLQAYCKVCKSDLYQDKREHYNQLSYLWTKRNREKRLDIQARYRNRNREELRKKGRAYSKANRQKHKERSRQWRQNNPDKARLTKHRRRTRERSLPYTFTLDQQERMFNYFDHSCAVCGIPQDMFTPLELDHWIPLNSDDCPGTVATNMIPLCGNRHGFANLTGCNPSKSDKHPLDWLIDTHGNRKGRAIYDRIQAYFAWVLEQDED